MTTQPEAMPVSLHPPAPLHDAEQLTQRVQVRAPYLALHDVYEQRPGLCSAWLSPEHALQAELGPIAAPEAGRHLAILGSLAAASLQTDPEPRYYLAHAARLERVSAPVTGRAPWLRAWASAHRASAREAAASCVLQTSTGEAVYRLLAEYTVLGPRLFARMFRGLERETPRFGANPHAEPLAFELQTLDARHGLARICFEVEHCAGHFERFPAVPVARVMHGLTTLAGRVLQCRRARPRATYLVQRADVRAHGLAFAGQELSLTAEVVDDSGDEVVFVCRASVMQTEVGEMHLWLAPGRAP